MKHIATLLLLSVLFFPGCAKKADWHQKLVLYLDTPTGPMTASSVIRVDFTGARAWMQQMDSNHTDLTGEAVVADLGGRYLFALIEEGAGKLIWLILSNENEDVGGFKESIRRVERQAEPLEVPRKLWPQMVTFGDIHDPKTVQLVDPHDLAASFGPGYAIRRLTIQVTEEPVTQGRVEAVLSASFFRTIAKNMKAALRRASEARKRGENEPYFRTLASEITRNEFIRGNK
ncbi:hypothetical protein M3P21_14805 [Ruegeria sp. 2012CJ41-6]|uniref:Uncharacterized protein n=1 Tax=Ruegeria spongiae TaxID=2942209 RepID=A0ABT0Q4L2_9RHOB|nr:hypothetical protein [Ruegeria spongiae]MCL6284804.1 hypothetical protein [Ruegeria spongiae]